MLVNMGSLLADAAKGGYAVGAFNFSTLESGLAAVSAAEATNCPFILQHAPAHERYLPLDMAAPIMIQLAKAAHVPVAVHLDHGTDIALCRHALDLGFTSVMIDASELPFEENVALTASVVAESRRRGASVEAELGPMPHNFNGEMGDCCVEEFYTRPVDAAQFVERTGVDALAISFGTVHGVYKAKPKLSLDVIERISEATRGLPLVMHGGSGLSDRDYRDAISRGIRKINYYTYGAIAGGKAVAALVKARGDGLQFHDVAMAAIKAMSEDIARVMEIFAMKKVVSCFAVLVLALAAHGITLPVCEVAERAQKEVSTYPGRVAPIAQVDVTPQVSGEILEVCFSNGAEVKEGDVLIFRYSFCI